ncbi:hypothetical protein PR202_gn00784 [Eleusine coracana subsp. coracana]|uniref:Terpene synthase N-terminal domain-containing protein n=1 Tax=Eleusine coracana subsp. coracana TaxID=191504 RepID=A0AAV5G4Y4_ELECO|nr:hypothetical protein PR202_gn00784 [Eleusine coracana subsp. coracana]
MGHHRCRIVSRSNQLSRPIVLMGYCKSHCVYRRKAIVFVVLAATSAGRRRCHHHFLGARWGKARAVAVEATGTMRFFAWDALRKNGSLFNSPAATAAALIHHYDDKAVNYLHCVVNIFGSAVPALYPPSIYSKLSMVDILEKVGISRHFHSEINSILDKAYMLWSQRDEEVMLDVATCAMAFRLLRMNGYDVSSEELSHVAEASAFSSSVEGYMDDTETILEMYKASEVCLSENEPILEKPPPSLSLFLSPLSPAPRPARPPRHARWRVLPVGSPPPPPPVRRVLPGGRRPLSPTTPCRCAARPGLEVTADRRPPPPPVDARQGPTVGGSSDHGDSSNHGGSSDHGDHGNSGGLSSSWRRALLPFLGDGRIRFGGRPSSPSSVTDGSGVVAASLLPFPASLPRADLAVALPDLAVT